MFGHWAWNPEECHWPTLRDSIYDFVWGPTQVPVIRELDDRFVELKKLYWLPDRAGFRTPDKGLVRLKDKADRAKALELLDTLDRLARILAEKSFDETALTAERLRDYYLDPLEVSLRFARKQATLEYPEFEFSRFEMNAEEILAEKGEPAANAYLAVARSKIPPLLARLSTELAELKDIEPVLDSWRRRLDRAANVAMVRQWRTRAAEAAWNALAGQPVKEFLPFLENPTESDLMAIFNGMNTGTAENTTPGPSRHDNWTAAPHHVRGAYRVGRFKRGAIKATAIVLPRRTQSCPGDFGCVEQTVPTPKLAPGTKLGARLFIADSRIDNVYRNVRFIEVAVNGTQLHRHDVSDPQATQWITLDLTESAARESLNIQVRVVENRGVADHTSWVFIGPLTLHVEPPVPRDKPGSID